MRPLCCLVFAALACPWSLFAEPAPTSAGLEAVPLTTDPGAAYADAARPFQGIPGVERAPSGRLWATWYGGGKDEGPDNYVMLATSADGGLTWSPVRYLIDPPGRTRAFDPGLWLDPKGRLWWSYAQSYGNWDNRGGVWVRVADDPDSDHPHWSEPRRISDGVKINKPIVLRDGAWIFPVALWRRAPHLDLPSSYALVSRDEGATFELRGGAHTADVVYDEPMVVQRKDDSLWMLIRTRHGIAESISHDEGASWTPGVLTVIPHIGSRFFLRRLQSGRLLLVKHNPPLDVTWHGGPQALDVPLQRSRLTAYLSADDGKTWKGGLVIDERTNISYPDGTQAPDGTIDLIYDRGRKAEREILLARFTEDDVLAGAWKSPAARQRLVVNRAGPVSQP